MTRKPKKLKPGNRYPDSTKREAKKIYLAEGCSEREIAERIGVQRQTIARWRREGDWEAARTEAERRANEKTVEKVADSEAELNERHDKLFGALETLGNAYIMSHQRVDPETGRKEIIPPDPKELRALTSAMRDCQAGQRLARGLPDRITENQDKPKDAPPDFDAMSDAELERLAGGNRHVPAAPTAGPTNGSGRIIN